NVGGYINGVFCDGWREPKPGEPEIIYIDDRQQSAQQPAKPAPQDANSPSNSEPMLEPLFNIGGFVNGWMRDGWREPKPGEPEIIYIDDTQQPAQQPANQPTQGDDSAPAQEQ
ncbi:MAG: hypothetical protein K1X71_13670, partial [Pirellulales bacterium]|nr:hypothetical protein [Pirellulales bacterium]